MTKSQIKAELRRSAMYDADPFYEVDSIAFEHAFAFLGKGDDSMWAAKFDTLRTFYLLVAEAL